MPIDPRDLPDDTTTGDADDEVAAELELSPDQAAALAALSDEELAALDDLSDQELAAHLTSLDPQYTGDAALVARARKKYGIAGAMLAGGMLGLDRMLTGKVKQEAPVEWEAPGDPIDIDRKGITVPLDDDAVVRSKPGPAAAAGAISRRVTRRRRG